MEFFKKIINKIRNLFKKQKLLTQGNNEENSVNSNNSHVTNIEKINIFDTDMRTKEEFFRMYQAYKDGKIKKEHILITDLIDIELMMMEEIALIDKEIKAEEDIRENQEREIARLLNQIAELEKR